MDKLSPEQAAILSHAAHRSPHGLYCGDSPEMQYLVKRGLMKSKGRVPWCPGEYFKITAKGQQLAPNQE